MSSGGAEALIVEDEPGLAELFELWLDDLYRVETVSTGEDAIETLEEHHDVVLLDWRLPTRSGPDILEYIRERDFSCRIVVITGFALETEEIDDADAILQKPITRDELLAVIGEFERSRV